MVHNEPMKTRVRDIAKATPVGGSFDDYVAEFEAGLDAEGQAMVQAYDVYYTLASQAIALRLERHWSQQAAAKAAGVQQSDISRLERGAGKLSVPKLFKIGHAYGKALAFVDP